MVAEYFLRSSDGRSSSACGAGAVARPPLPLRERVGVRGLFRLADGRPSGKDPSSDASRHLLPQGEKGRTISRGTRWAWLARRIADRVKIWRSGRISKALRVFWRANAFVVVLCVAGSAHADISTSDAWAMFRKVCVEAGPGLTMLDAGEAAAKERGWTSEWPTPNHTSKMGLVGPNGLGDREKAMAMTLVEQNWSDGALDDDPKLSVTVYDRTEFPTLQFDICSLTLPGNAQKEIEPEARADRGRSALAPQGFQPDQVHIVLSKEDLPFGNSISNSDFVTMMKAGIAVISMASFDVGIPTGGTDRIRRKAEVVEHPGSDLPSKTRIQPIVLHARHVTQVSTFYVHVPTDIWDQAGNRVLWLITP